MNKLDIVKLSLTEGDLITKDSIDTIENNLAKMKNRTESIEYAEQMESVPDLVTGGGETNQTVVQGLKDIVDALQGKGFMAQ